MARDDRSRFDKRALDVVEAVRAERVAAWRGHLAHFLAAQYPPGLRVRLLRLARRHLGTLRRWGVRRVARLPQARRALEAAGLTLTPRPRRGEGGGRP